MKDFFPHDGHPDSAFIERVYREALALVQETASYLEREGLGERDALSAEIRTVFTGESLRVTTRLMQVVAWLLVHRAVAQGEMSSGEALTSGRRLGGHAICLGPAMDGAEALPHRLRALMAASRQIYERIARLEERMLAGGEADNPVHDLLRRLDP